MDGAANQPIALELKLVQIRGHEYVKVSFKVTEIDLERYININVSRSRLGGSPAPCMRHTFTTVKDVWLAKYVAKIPGFNSIASNPEVIE